MLVEIVKWLFQLPGRLAGGIFKNRLTIFIFFMLLAAVLFGIKHYLRAPQPSDELAAAPLRHYAITRELPHREAREHCDGPLQDNNGQPWPSAPGYLHHPMRQAGANAQSLTLDNQHNNFPVVVKLEPQNAPQQSAEVFIPASGRFNIKITPAQEYVVKIKDINSGCFFQSPPVTLDKTPQQRLSLQLAAAEGIPFHPIGNGGF
ncbi:hypothetical protein GCM10023078_03550 [Gibbsiella greigii]